MNITSPNLIDRDRHSLCGFVPHKTYAVADNDTLWLQNNPVILRIEGMNFSEMLVI